MSTEAINRNRAGAASLGDRDERARESVKQFRKMQHGLTSYARAITSNKKVRVQLDNGTPRTDGTTIFYRPPIALGDKTPHVRRDCDVRDEVTGLLICPACKVREEVLVNIYHEIAHIAFGTFAPTTERAKVSAVQHAVNEHDSKFADKVRAAFEKAPNKTKDSYLGLASLISPFMPHLVNCIEDARVDSAMFAARKGTRKMVTADTFSLFRDGIPQPDGEHKHWSDAPLNNQAAIACYLAGAGYLGWEQYLHPKIGADFADKQLKQLTSRIAKARSASETYELSFPILARLRELGYFRLPEEEPEPEQQPDPEPQQEDPSDEAQDEEGESDDPTDDSDSGEGDADGSDSDEPSDEPGQAGESEADSEAAGSESDGESEAGEAEADSASEGESADSGSDESPVDDGDAGEGQGDGSSEGDDGAGSDESDSAPESGGGSSGESPDDEPGLDGEGDVPPGEGSGQEGDGDQPDGERGDGDRQEGGETESDEGGEGSATTDHAPEASDGDTTPDGDADLASGDGDESDDAEGGDSSGAGTAEEGGAERDGGQPPGEAQAGSGEGSSPEQAGDDDVQDGTLGEGDPVNAQGSDLDHEGGEADGRDEAGDADLPDPEGRDAEQRTDGPGDDDEEPSDDPEGIHESGADQGVGGIKVAEELNYGTVEEYGAPEEGGDLHDHIGDQHDPETEGLSHAKLDATQEADDAAVKLAIIQGMYFETPSTNVTGVSVWTDPADEESPSWGAWLDISDQQKRFLGVECDMDIPESVMGPALLRLRRVFSDNQIAAHENNRKSGRVDKRVLGRRARSGDSRLFTKKRLPGKRNYAVLIGIDLSSSTLGDNLALAKRAAFAQADLCARLGVEFAVYGHNANRSTLGGLGMDIYVIKSWDQPWNEAARDRIGVIGAAGGNLDGHTMEYYRKALDAVQATDKVLMYYTDGKMPAANYEEELTVLQREIKICKQRAYTLMAVGIRTDSPIQHGLDTVQVDDDSDLQRVVEHLGKRLAAPGR
jgi:hypothetical protein